MRAIVTAVLALWVAASPRGADGVGKADLPPWSVALEGGGTVSLWAGPSQGFVGLGVSRLLWARRLELSVAFRWARAPLEMDFGFVGGVAYRWAWGPLSLVAGARAGYAVMRVYFGERSSLTGALLLNPAAELRLLLGRRWELRAAPLSFIFYWNDLWMRAWAPSGGFGVRF